MAGDVWTDEENDLIVADYFAMLADDLTATGYNKAAHNRELQRLTGRSEGSVTFKFRNISAVLKALGEVWIEGYHPALNFQSSLVDAVARWLAAHPAWQAGPSGPAPSFHLQEGMPLFIDPPPTHRNTPPPLEAEQTAAIAHMRDVAGRDERNRALGRAGEECVLAHERQFLTANGKPDLARDVRWTSQEDGDGAGYDIASFELDGRPRLIEVKTTNGWERTPFHISRNECRVAEARRDHWRLLRLWNFARTPRAFEIRPPLEAHVALTPTSFQATLH